MNRVRIWAKMAFGRKFRDCKHIVLYWLLITLLFLFYQRNSHHDSTKSKKMNLNYLRSIKEDIELAYTQFHLYEIYIEKMANKLRKETSVGDFKKVIDKDTSAKCLTAPFLLIQIHSHPKNFISRQAIRLSWGNKDLGINSSAGKRLRTR
jgi:hypothetical protein